MDREVVVMFLCIVFAGEEPFLRLKMVQEDNVRPTIRVSGKAVARL
jgi:hypothetical protein